MTDGNIFEGVNITIAEKSKKELKQESLRQERTIEELCRSQANQARMSRLEQKTKEFEEGKWAKWLAGGERKVMRGETVSE